MKKYLFLSFFFFSSCSSMEYPHSASHVQIVRKKADLDLRCKVLGKLKLRSSALSPIDEPDIREDVLEAGGDTVYLYKSKDDGSRVTTYGYVLRCRGPLAKAHQTTPKKSTSLPAPPLLLEVPNFSPAPAEPLPEPPLDSLPEAAPAPN